MDSLDLEQLRERFLQVYDSDVDAVYRFCLFQTSSKTLADDLCQDAFIKTWDYLANGKEVENLRAFVFRVARNLIIDYRRKKKSHSLDAITETGVDFDSDHDEMDHSETRSDIGFTLELIENLPDHHKEIITLRFVNDLTVPEIADLLDERANTVSVKLHRALDKLKILLSDYEEPN